MNKRVEQDWLSHPIVSAILKIGGWGLYAVITVVFVIGLLEIVDTRNERIWQVILMFGKIAGVAWVFSWVVFIVVGLVDWVANKLRKNDHNTQDI